MLQRSAMLLGRLSSVVNATQRTFSHATTQLQPVMAAEAFRGMATDARAAEPGFEDLTPEEKRKKLIGALMYRSKQRGFLELDLLVGLWAQKHLHAMDLPALAAFSEVLSEENPDLFKWLTGQEEPSPHMAGNAAFQAMRIDVMKQLEENRPSESATVPGTTWLRGWDDWKKPQAASEPPSAST